METKASKVHDDTLKEVKQLLKEGADGNLRNREGYTLLQLAVRNGHKECLELLIKEGKANLGARGQ